MNRVVLQSGYDIPFNGVRRKRRGRRSFSAGMKRQQGVMKACAKKWDGSGSYKAFMKHCLRSK